MADLGFVRGSLAGIPDDTTKRILIAVFEHLLQTPGLTVGAPDHQTRATNLKATYELSTTATSTLEFSIVHGLETTPVVAIPVLDLSQPGAALVPLVVTRAADSRRVYLKAPAGSTSAPFALLLE